MSVSNLQHLKEFISCVGTLTCIFTIGVQAQARAALVRAEAAVKEARRHVDALEAEAREQARLAAVAAQEANVKMQAVNGVS